MTAPIRLLVADDHRLLREGLVRIITVQPDMTVVAEANNGAEAVEQFTRQRPDVTVMDLQLPIMTGLQAIRAIREIDPLARIVVLTIIMAMKTSSRRFRPAPWPIC